jgi:hypothetical protein
LFCQIFVDCIVGFWQVLEYTVLTGILTANYYGRNGDTKCFCSTGESIINERRREKKRK